MKITFLGAGSTVFAKNVLGDCLLAENLPQFDIALLDISMPGMDGFTLCKELRNRSKTLGIIMLTTYCPLQSAKESPELATMHFQAVIT